ncbi:MAG: RimK family alpha-L-glutamate ligase [Caulobacterales bacterium]
MAAAALRQPAAPSSPEPPATRGLADFAQMVFQSQNLSAVWNESMARATAIPPDVGAMLDLSTILQLVGDRTQGLALQADALALQRCYRRTMGDGVGPRLLALVAPGDLMANTPLEFMLKGWNGVLDYLFIDTAAPAQILVPDHDVAILAVGESDANAELLGALTIALAAWPRPMLNGAPARVLTLGRDRAPQRLAGIPTIDSPVTRRLAREALSELASGRAPLDQLLPGCRFPVLVRPVDSHAGAGLEKLVSSNALAAYLQQQAGEAFYLTPFIDYRGSDGFYRKLRVALIDGRPFISHMAVSDYWMIHYLNAGMDRDASKRAEEAATMASFETGFAARHAGAFQALAQRFGLDYFAVDCAETREGRLLIFEADTAMIIHDMDPPDLYPYKGPAMAKLFTAFQDLVNRSARR